MVRIRIRNIPLYLRTLSDPIHRTALIAGFESEFKRAMLLTEGTTLRRTPFAVHGNPDGVSLRYWHPNAPQASGNFGDLLSPVICGFFAKELCGADLTGPAVRPTALYALGSLLQRISESAVVWGTGLDFVYSMMMTPRPEALDLDIRAVRGPMTAAFLRYQGFKVPEVFGDPAILMPTVYQPHQTTSATWQLPQPDNAVHSSHSSPTSHNQHTGRRVLVIQHHEGMNLLWAGGFPDASIADQPNTEWRSSAIHIGRDTVIAASAWTSDWRQLVDLIASADVVISSALHGIIVAEAYGIPAIHLIDHPSSGTKAADYYLSTARPYPPRAMSLSEALSLPTPPVPDLTRLRNDLLASFPTDLWFNVDSAGE